MGNVYAVAAKTPGKPSDRGFGSTSGKINPCHNPPTRKMANIAINTVTIRIPTFFTPLTSSATKTMTAIMAINGIWAETKPSTAGAIFEKRYKS